MVQWLKCVNRIRTSECVYSAAMNERKCIFRWMDVYFCMIMPFEIQIKSYFENSISTENVCFYFLLYHWIRGQSLWLVKKVYYQSVFGRRIFQFSARISTRNFNSIMPFVVLCVKDCFANVLPFACVVIRHSTVWFCLQLDAMQQWYPTNISSNTLQISSSKGNWILHIIARKSSE